MCLTSERPFKPRLRSDLVRCLRSSNLDREKATDMDQVYSGDKVMTKGSPEAMEPRVTPNQ